MNAVSREVKVGQKQWWLRRANIMTQIRIFRSISKAFYTYTVFSPVLDYAYDRRLKLGFPENCLTKEWIHLWLGDEDKEHMEEEGGIIGILSSLTSSFRCSCDERNTQLYQTKCSENVLTVRSVTFKRHTHEASNRFHGRHDSQAV